MINALAGAGDRGARRPDRTSEQHEKYKAIVGIGTEFVRLLHPPSTSEHYLLGCSSPSLIVFYNSHHPDTA